MNYEELFARIDTFKQLKLQKEKVFALDADGRTHYVCADAHGVNVFPDQQALGLYHTLSAAHGEMGMWDDSTLRQDCIRLSLTDRDGLDKQDYALIKELGRTYRGRGQWPQLRRLRPYCLPWQLDEADCALLGRALEAVQDAACISVSGKMEEAGDAPVHLRDEMLLARLKNLPCKDQRWDVTIQAFPFPAGDEEGGAPYFPMMLMAVDEQSDTVLHVGLEDCRKTDGMEKLVLGFAAEMIGHGARPGSLLCANARAFAVLGELFEKLGVKSKVQPQLPQLEEALMSLVNFPANEQE